MTVPLSYADSLAYVRTHPPAGLTYSGDSSGGGSGAGPVGGYFYNHADSSARNEAQLDVGVLGTGPTSSTWRLDGLALTLDPAPVQVQVQVQVHQQSPAFRLTTSGTPRPAIGVPALSRTPDPGWRRTAYPARRRAL